MPNPDYNVVVIGAGFTGITAARELQRSGLDTLLIEARDRIGGRTHTIDFHGHPLEMGGMNVHWIEPYIWSELNRYGIPIRENDPFDTFILVDGETHRRYAPAEAGRRFRTIFERFFEPFDRSIMPRPHDPLFRREMVAEVDRLSLRDRFDAVELSPEDRKWLGGWLSFHAGGPIEHGAMASLLRTYALANWNYETMLDIMGRYRIVGGSARLLSLMLDDAACDIRLSLPVAAIADDDAGVTVTARDGKRFTASAAVVAVPVNTWPQIAFSPALAAPRAEAAQAGFMAPNVTKIWVLVRHGGNERVMVQWPEGSPISVLRSDAQIGGDLLMVALSTDPEFDVQDRGGVERIIRSVLPSAEVIDMATTAWGSEEFTRGAIPCMRPGQLSRYYERLREPDGRLFFAVSDLGSGFTGIDGAIEQGHTAARHVRAFLSQKSGLNSNPIGVGCRSGRVRQPL